MSNKLKIYACSGIGSTNGEQRYTYWTDNTSTLTNTQAVNTLLVRINTLYTEVIYLRPTKEQIIACLNGIDLYTVCLEAARRFAGNNERLMHAGKVIGAMFKQGVFDSDELDNRRRDEHLDDLIDQANAAFDDEQPVDGQDEEFNLWWSESIVAKNQCGLTKEEQEASQKTLASAAIKGIGEADPNWKNDGDISEYLTKAGTYFLYLYFTDEQLARLPKVFEKKRMYQQQVYNYCKSYFVGVYGSEADMKDIIRNGIIAECKDEPETICGAIASGKQKGIGISEFLLWLGVKGFIALIAAIGAVLVGIVTAICDCVYKSNVEKYAAMNKAAADKGGPGEDDYDDLDYDSTTWNGQQKNKKILYALLAGAAALFIFKK